MDRLTVVALLVLVSVPLAVPGTLRDMKERRAVEASPRETATVRKKWVVAAGRFTQHWVSLETPAGRRWDMRLPSVDWASLRVGGPMTVAMAPGAVPHSVNSGVDGSSTPWMLAVEAAAFLAAGGFLFNRFRESRGRGSDLSPEAELARQAAAGHSAAGHSAAGHSAEVQRPRF